MESFYMICAGVATAALVTAVIFLVRTLEQLRITAEQARRTAQAVEHLALHLDQNVEAVSGVTRKIYEFTDGLQSGWMRAAQLAVGFFNSLRERWSDGGRKDQPASEARAREEEESEA